MVRSRPAAGQYIARARQEENTPLKACPTPDKQRTKRCRNGAVRKRLNTKRHMPDPLISSHQSAVEQKNRLYVPRIGPENLRMRDA